MSQATDYAVANASGASVRADINSIFAAVASSNSGTAEPSTTYSFMIWVDTTNNVVKLRNGANDAWLTMPFSMTASNTVDINGGTVDGATIGASSASSIVGTTIVANTSLNIASDGATVTGIKDEDNMSSDSATKLATQQSIKAYVDSQVGTVDTLAEILANGNTTGGTDIAVSAADDITFTDSSKAIFGDGSDLQIYHDASDSFIDEQGTGSLKIRATNLALQDAAGALMAFGSSGAGFYLYHNGSEKLVTATGGIDVTGKLDVNSASDNEALILESTDTEVYATFTDTTGSAYIKSRADFRFEVGSADQVKIGSSETVVNDASNDYDFRVESNGNANMLFVDGGNDRVGIGTASPGVTLDVNGAITASSHITIPAASRLYLDGGGNTFIEETSADTMTFTTNNIERIRIDSSGMLGLGTTPPADSHTTWSQFFIGQKGSLISERLGSGGNYGTTLTDNLYVDSDTGAYANITTNESSAYIQEAGNHLFYSQASGSAGAAVTLDERMRIDSSGRVGIGTTSPTGILHTSTSSNSVGRFESTDATAYIQINDTDDSLYITTAGQKGSFGGNASVHANNLNIDLTNGNVGIGTTSPSSVLSVKSDVNNNVNNGILFEAADSTNKLLQLYENSTGECYMGFYQADTQTALIRTNGSSYFNGGNVGIGTDSPDGILHVDGHTGSVSSIFEANGNGDTVPVKLKVKANDGTTSLEGLEGQAGSASTDNALSILATNYLQFKTGASERMRINSSGQLLVGISSAYDSDFKIGGTALVGSSLIGTQNSTTGATHYAAIFRSNGNSTIGSILTSNTGTSYNTGSDYRLKDVKGSIQNGLERTLALNPVEFTWKSDGKTSEGFIAHEVQEAGWSDGISGHKDSEKTQEMDYGRITPLLVKAIQELSAEVEQLKQQAHDKCDN